VLVKFIPKSQLLAIVNVTEKVPEFEVHKVIYLQAVVVSPDPVQPSYVISESEEEAL
jgi:hypothetical protein